MDEQQHEDQPAEATPGADEGTGTPKRQRSREYAARRRGWIGEHSRDDHFLMFVGVAVFLAVAFLIAYGVITNISEKEKYAPVPPAKLFHAPAEEIAPGLVRVKYTFPYDRRHYSVREACPQVLDWQLQGRMDGHGIMVGGMGVHRPFYVPGDLSVECDVALVTGSKVSIMLRSIYDHREQDYLRFDLTAYRGKDWASTAQLSVYENGARIASGRLVEIPPLRARRDPPLFYRAKLVLSGNTLRGYYGPSSKKLQKVCEMTVEDHLGAGKVVLTGELSHTAYDNVVITGRPHEKFIDTRTRLYYLLGMDKPAEAGAAESGPPLRESGPESGPPIRLPSAVSAPPRKN
jgi:hypothetical protein